MPARLLLVTAGTRAHNATQHSFGQVVPSSVLAEGEARTHVKDLGIGCGEQTRRLWSQEASSAAKSGVGKPMNQNRNSTWFATLWRPPHARYTSPGYCVPSA